MLPGSRPGEIPGLRTGSDSSAVGPASRRPRCGSFAPEALEPRRLLSATWFVSTTGSDQSPGTIGAPFQTIQHAAGLAGPGDVVDIRGGVYRETVRPAQSGQPGAPITFQAYDGENVRVNGADPLADWSQYQGDIYQAAAPGDLGFGNNQIFVNDRAMAEASWPATGLDLSHPKLATVQGGGYGLTDPALSSSGVDWTGGVVHIISGQGWVSQTATISGQSGNHITFNLAGTVDPHGGVTAGNRYYLTGKLAALQSPGQFYVGNGGVYLRTPDGSSPGANAVEFKHRLYGFNLGGRSNVTVRGVNLFACTIVANGSSGIHLDAITAKYVSQFVVCPNGWSPPGNTGIVLNGSNNSITNSVVAYSAGNGIFVNGYGNTVRNCVVRDCDYTATDTAGIYTWGGNDTIANNTVYDCGRDGIHFSGTTNTQVTGNLVHDVVLQSTDGGAIYTFGTDGAGSSIAYNRVSNIHSGGWGAAGLYLDNNSHNFSVHNNDVSGVDIGLKMNPTSLNESIVNNTLIAGMQSVASYGSRNMSGSQFIGNVFNNTLMIGGSVKMSGNVSSGDTSGVGSAGAGIDGSLPPSPDAPAAALTSASVVKSASPAATTPAAAAPVTTPAALTGAAAVQADESQLTADLQAGRAALAADAAAARAAVAADAASIAADRVKIRKDRGDKAALTADRSRAAADRLKLRTDAAAGKAKLAQDKAALAGKVKADKVRISADRRASRKAAKARKRTAA